MCYILFGLIVLLIILMIVYNITNYALQRYRDYNDYVCGRITEEEFLEREIEREKGKKDEP